MPVPYHPWPSFEHVIDAGDDDDSVPIQSLIVDDHTDVVVCIMSCI